MKRLIFFLFLLLQAVAFSGCNTSNKSNDDIIYEVKETIIDFEQNSDIINQDMEIKKEDTDTSDFDRDATDLSEICTPQCNEKECGDNGCAGSCGECSEGKNCVQGKCIETCSAQCDDGQIKCVSNIEYVQCEKQQNNCFNWSDTKISCKTNELCKNNKCFCASPCGENCCSDEQVCNSGSCCTPDCKNKICGDDGCGGSCGECKQNYFCYKGVCKCGGAECDDTCCEAGTVCFDNQCCKPDCKGKKCGDNGCGGICGICPVNSSCKNDFNCHCDFTECNEKCCGPDELCFKGACCKPDCTDKTCGSDGCGGSCGECDNLKVCKNGKCECAFNECNNECCNQNEVCFDNNCCTANCNNKQCGNDNCGGSCGECDKEETCVNGSCKCLNLICDGVCCAPDQVCAEGTCCTPDCKNKSCGSDGCGGSCGTCLNDAKCMQGTCYNMDCNSISNKGCCFNGYALWCDQGNAKINDCGTENPECGWDGAYYSCGTDGGSDPSSVFEKKCTGITKCEKQCSEKECGADGCGGFCGTCGANKTCLNNVCFSQFQTGEMIFKWRVVDKNLTMTVEAPTTGWVAVGFKPENSMKGANIIIAYVSQGTVFARDDFGISEYSHESDISLGGTDNISNLSGMESNDKTRISFTIPLNSGDLYDVSLSPGETVPIIAAYGSDESDNFSSKHVWIGVGQIDL